MLIKLYSDTDLIKTVRFHKGINIVLGKKHSKDKKTNSVNGIGKSCLIRLIDFTLLSSKAEGIFKEKACSFLKDEEHTITLEFQVREKKYFIKRFFSNLDKIHFGENTNELHEYQKSDIARVLEELFFPTETQEMLLEGKNYRTLMNFFIKDDIQNQKRIDPLKFFFSSATTKQVALYNFYLLNLPTKRLLSYDKALSEFEKYNSAIKNLELISGKKKNETDSQDHRVNKIKEEIDLSERLQFFFTISAYRARAK